MISQSYFNICRVRYVRLDYFVLVGLGLVRLGYARLDKFRTSQILLNRQNSIKIFFTLFQVRFFFYTDNNSGSSIRCQSDKYY